MARCPTEPTSAAPDPGVPGPAAAEDADSACPSAGRAAAVGVPAGDGVSGAADQRSARCAARHHLQQAPPPAAGHRAAREPGGHVGQDVTSYGDVILMSTITSYDSTAGWVIIWNVTTLWYRGVVWVCFVLIFHPTNELPML